MLDSFKKIVDSEKISHAYIIEGSKKSDKIHMAKLFAKEILRDDPQASVKIDNDNHEDLMYVYAAGISIKDEAIEDLQSKLKKKPFSGSRNIVIIENADTMTLRAQNRLLKTLEEPFPGTVIILLSDNVENLIQTIRSRCVILRMRDKLNLNQHSEFENAIKLEDMILNKELTFEIFSYVTSLNLDKESSINFLDDLGRWYSAMVLYHYEPDNYEYIPQNNIIVLKEKSKLYKKELIYKYVGLIEEARQEILRNISISYTLKNLILKIGG